VSGQNAGNPYLTKLLKRVRKAGWRTEQSQKGWKLFSPNGKDIVTVHTSSSDHHYIKNIEADLRRAGL
jgi:hypothetical protein